MTPLEMFLAGVVVTGLTTAFGLLMNRYKEVLRQNRRLKIYIITNCAEKAEGLEMMAEAILGDGGEG